MLPRLGYVALLLAAQAACTGTAATSDDPAPFVPGEAAALVFSCDSTQAPAQLPLPRLSRGELENTLRFAVLATGISDADAVWASAGAAVARFPADVRTPSPGDLRGGYSRTDQAIQQAQVDALYDISQALARELTTAARRPKLLGECATNASTADDRNCLESFIARWAGRLFRAPLTADDVRFYADIAGETPVSAAAVADVLVALLNAPEVVYRVEHGSDSGKALSDFEIAARLSYQYWRQPPDDELWAAAERGELSTAEGFEQQLDRLVRDPRVRESVDEFITEWLRLAELPPLDALKSDPGFIAFAGANLPNGSSRDEMITDVLESAAATLQSGGNLSGFLRDPHAYARGDFLAAIYDVPVWSGTGEAPRWSSPRRSGLLTRAAMLSTGTRNTRPIHRGYLVRNALLCQKVGVPPPNAMVVPPAPSAGLSTRQAVTALTQGGVCGGCHFTTINPPGFLSEAFDALGRERTAERLFDDQGKELGGLPIQTSAIPAVQANDTRELSDVVELTQAIDESQLFHSCAARQYFRFSQRRTESETADGCLLSTLEQSARSGAPLTELLKAVARDPQFKTRGF